MSRFTNRVALITGGGTGIGRASAELIAAEGGQVVVVGRREEPLAALAKEYPDNIHYTTADLAAADGAKRAVEYTLQKFDRLDILINNAGVGILGPLAELDDKSLDLLYSVNVTGLLRITREALPALTKNHGAVVNISSTVAQAAFPGSAAYAGTKAAVERITASLATELGGTGVRVNAVAPGVTETDMAKDALNDEMKAMMISQTPLGRIGQPGDIAKAVAFLASDDASWITGQILQSSGGFML